jgi:hypothetical protein
MIRDTHCPVFLSLISYARWLCAIAVPKTVQNAYNQRESGKVKLPLSDPKELLRKNCDGLRIGDEISTSVEDERYSTQAALSNSVIERFFSAFILSEQRPPAPPRRDDRRGNSWILPRRNKILDSERANKKSLVAWGLGAINFVDVVPLNKVKT